MNERSSTRTQFARHSGLRNVMVTLARIALTPLNPAERIYFSHFVVSGSLGVSGGMQNDDLLAVPTRRVGFRAKVLPIMCASDRNQPMYILFFVKASNQPFLHKRLVGILTRVSCRHPSWKRKCKQHHRKTNYVALDNIWEATESRAIRYISCGLKKGNCLTHPPNPTAHLAAIIISNICPGFHTTSHLTGGFHATALCWQSGRGTFLDACWAPAKKPH